MSTLAEAPTPGLDDVEPCEHETRDRIITGTVTVLPVLCLLIVAWQVWGDWLGWNDIFVFLILYVIRALGITVGSPRLFTHRSFKTSPFMRGVFTVLGSAAIEGPVISWVADHRKHHAFSDRPGDPHSPHVDHGSGWRGALKGLTHAHVGWLFLHMHRGLRARYAPDLIADPVVSKVDKLFIPCVAGGLVAPFLLGWLFGGTLRDGFTGMLWGGAVRILVLHHATYSRRSASPGTSYASRPSARRRSTLTRLERHRATPHPAGRGPSAAAVPGRPLGRHGAAADRRRRRADVHRPLARGARPPAARPRAARARPRVRGGRARRRRHRRGAPAAGRLQRPAGRREGEGRAGRRRRPCRCPQAGSAHPVGRAAAAGPAPLPCARQARRHPPLRRLERVLRPVPRRVDDVLVRDLVARCDDARGGAGHQARPRLHEARARGGRAGPRRRLGLGRVRDPRRVALRRARHRHHAVRAAGARRP